MTSLIAPSSDGLVELMAGTAAMTPNRVAVVDETSSVSYGSLMAEVWRIESLFRTNGVTAGTRVAIWCPNSSFWLAVSLAIARLGAIAIGVNARYPVAETARVLRAADARVLVIDPGSMGAASEAIARELVDDAGIALDVVFVRDGELTMPGPVTVVDIAGSTPADVGDAGAATPSIDDGFIAFASSGSTGRPKLILHTQRAVVAHSRAVASSFGYTRPDTVVLGQLPLCGVWGFNTAFAALAAGATIVMMERYEPHRAAALVQQYRITHANGPDQFVRSLFAAADDGGLEISSMWSLGFSTFSNDAAELVEMGDARGVSLFQVYGSSEQQALMLHQPIQGTPAERADAGGHPSNPLTQVRIRDVETGEIVVGSEPGMIESTGPNAMLGYLVDGRVDRSAFTSDGWIVTGDIGQIAEHGVRYLTRAKDVLRLSGFLVDPKEIELIVERDPTVAEAKAVAIDIDGKQRCVTFVRLNDHAAFDAETIRQHCAAELATYKVPARIHAIDELPRIDGTNGPRIQRLALRDLALEFEGAQA